MWESIVLWGLRSLALLLTVLCLSQLVTLLRLVDEVTAPTAMPSLAAMELRE